MLRFWCAVVFSISLTVGTTTRAERPTAAYLLPEKTVGYLRIANASELSSRFGATAMGRITSDEQVQPFVGHLYSAALDAFKRIEDQVGASLEELLAIPQGEVCVALIVPEAGEPQLAVILEVGQAMPAAEKLLQRGDDLLIQGGNARRTEEFGPVELTIYQMAGERRRELVIFDRDDVVVLTTNVALSQSILLRWDGIEESRTLADNRKFASIMNRSRGLKDEPPQITWFVDPMEFVQRLAQGNFSRQAGLATAKGLGLDGLKALGGGIILATEEFDAVAQSHVLIGHPREGVLNMLALETGDVTPEPWVPRDAASYATFHWNFEQTYGELVRLYDIFRGEGAWDQQVAEGISNQLGIDLEQQIIKAAEGRVTMVNWIEKPARLNSQATLFAFRLKDAGEFQGTLETAVGKVSRLESKSYRGTKYYLMEPGQRRDQSPNESLTRIPQPSVAVLGDYLILTDSEKFLQETIITKGDSSRSLANELDFKIVLNKVQRQLGPTKASLVSFHRPEESFRLIYDLATSPDTRDRLRQADNPVLKTLREALEENPLPPFSVLAKYLAPGGALLTYDELGLHHTSFTLMRQ